MTRLQLALTAAEAKAWDSSKLQLAAAQELDFEARVARLESPAGKPFRPHTSLVEQSPVAVNARELLKRARSDIHGSVSVGIDSEGRWGTQLELHKQLSPHLLLGIGFSVGDNDSSAAQLALDKQVSTSLSFGVELSMAYHYSWDYGWD